MGKKRAKDLIERRWESNMVEVEVEVEVEDEEEEESGCALNYLIALQTIKTSTSHHKKLSQRKLSWSRNESGDDHQVTHQSSIYLKRGRKEGS